jgi:DNA replicative helicase MCM subunit Mcm2 (Cdc46/Mcm family)
VWAYDALVDVAKPGDRVELCGIFRASASRVSARQRNEKTIYRTCECNNVTQVHFNDCIYVINFKTLAELELTTQQLIAYCCSYYAAIL